MSIDGDEKHSKAPFGTPKIRSAPSTAPFSMTLYWRYQEKVTLAEVINRAGLSDSSVCPAFISRNYFELVMPFRVRALV
jgi:hypothetical protein